MVYTESKPSFLETVLALGLAIVIATFGIMVCMAFYATSWAYGACYKVFTWCKSRMPRKIVSRGLAREGKG